jgi:hypothetical protein
MAKPQQLMVAFNDAEFLGASVSGGIENQAEPLR